MDILNLLFKLLQGGLGNLAGVVFMKNPELSLQSILVTDNISGR